MPLTRGRHTRSTVILVAASVLCGIAATGCASSPTAPPSGNSPASAEPAPEPSVALPPDPQPFVDLDCADMLTAAEVDAALRNPVRLLPAVQWRELGSNAGPASFAVRQSGGLECEWSNGQPAVNDSASKDQVGIVVRVLPNAADHWSRYADYYSVDGTEKLGCDTADPSGPCSIDSLFEDTWVQVAAWGLDGNGGQAARAAAMRRIADTVRRSVAAADANASTWSPPPGTIPVAAHRCDEFFSSTDVTAALDLTGKLYLSGMDGGESLIGAAWIDANARPCPWATPHGLGIRGGLRVLPGGEWAWNITRAADSAGYATVAIPGLAPEDGAYMRCSPAGNCTVEIVLGHNWVQIYLDQGADRVGPTRSALRTLAAKAVSSVRT